MMAAPIIVVGAGLAGLSCAHRLMQARTPFLLLEASDAVGGRVRTDVVDGFQLDRGFQIYLTAYPEGHRLLDYEPLQFGTFQPGALVRYQGRWHRVVDPFRDPLAALPTLFNPIGTVADKLRVALLREKVVAGTLAHQWQQTEKMTLDFLRWEGGFSDALIHRFFRPFLGGVFLDPTLSTSSRMLRFVFRMFARGSAVVPARGMQALPQQLADRLPSDCVRLNTPVAAVRPDGVTLADGTTLPARAVVVATEGPTARRLLGKAALPAQPGVGTVNLYYTTPTSPLSEPLLALNGDGTGPINSVVDLARVAPSYAPAGQALLSVSVVGIPAEDDARLEADVRLQLVDWFGLAARTYRHLRTYRIPYALPDQTAPALAEPRRSVCVRPGLFVCGDHRDNASIDGALTSGWRTAQAVLSAE
jgi:phytoene dehydrogenase-like protein